MARTRPRPWLVASVRDILVTKPDPQRYAWMRDLALAHYDRVLAHTDPALVPFGLTFPYADALGPRLVSTGYVVDPGPPPCAGDEVLVSAGGGRVGGRLLATALAARPLTGLSRRPWRLIAGGASAADELAGLAADLPAGVVVEQQRDDFQALLAKSLLSVSQAGYNTVVEVLRLGKPMVLVPFETATETEQTIRARRLRDRGLAEVVWESELTPIGLARAIDAMIGRPAAQRPALDLDGAAASAAPRGGARRPAGAGGARPMTSWRALEATLDAIALRGEAIRVWWRDDDAGRDHPALDRLLELAERRDLPLALAVVPLWLEPPVQAAIAASARATVLQHGYAHASHAAPGSKPIELGGRAPGAILAELEQGRAALSDAFGAIFLAVLVPPWNRVEPALLARLGALGFRGLSTFGRRPDDAGRPRLHQVNTHLDPIDWRGSRLFIGEAGGPRAAVRGPRPGRADRHPQPPSGHGRGRLALPRPAARGAGPTSGRPPVRGGRAVRERRMSGPLLQVEDLAVDFLADEGLVQAVRGVSFTVEAGQTVALVGESGSGKTVISQAVLGILPQSARISRGKIILRDPERQHEPVDLASYADDHPVRRSIRGARISIIFQEPMSSLSPLHTIGDQISEALLLHSDVDRAAGKARTIEMLARVGFPDPEHAFRAYPFELSGGLRQRAMIAMALVCDPALLIADEPTTALDVTIQAQILQLMQELQQEFQMAILFITHDLGVVANMADEVVVLYRGQVMESGSCQALLSRPRHPYLQALLHAVPRLTMAPGERLTPLREVSAASRALLIERPGPGERRRAGAPGRPGRARCSRSTTSARPSRPARAAGSAVMPGRWWRSTTSASASRAASRSGWSARAAAARPRRRRRSCARSRPMPAGSPSTRPTGRSTCWPCTATSWSASAAGCSTSSRTRSTPSTRA